LIFEKWLLKLKIALDIKKKKNHGKRRKIIKKYETYSILLTGDATEKTLNNIIKQ